MIEVLITPGMKVKVPTMSWNIGYVKSTHKNYKEARQAPSAVTFRPPKDGWYPCNILTEEIYK